MWERLCERVYRRMQGSVAPIGLAQLIFHTMHMQSKIFFQYFRMLRTSGHRIDGPFDSRFEVL